MFSNANTRGPARPDDGLVEMIERPPTRSTTVDHRRHAIREAQLVREHRAVVESSNARGCRSNQESRSSPKRLRPSGLAIPGCPLPPPQLTIPRRQRPAGHRSRSWDRSRVRL